MTRGTTSLEWGYGPDHSRAKQVQTVGSTTNTTWYFDDAASGVSFERVEGPSLATWSDYLFAGGQRVGVRIARSDATTSTRYFVKDHLGSVAVITNEAGAVAERLAFDAWGKRRHPNGADDAANILTASATTRGFSDHEMIDEIDLVNMNGRVYDPAIGRFLSADPFIHDVTNSQDLNRYSYVHNNPLSYTDMNGYGFFKSLGKFFKTFWKPLLAIVAAITLQFYILPTLLPGLATATIGNFAVGKAVIAGISSGVGNVIVTGKPKAFLAGFGQAVATFGVGHGLFKGDIAFGSAKWAGKAVAHGVVGGAFAEIRGGSFKSGFLAAGFSSAVAPLGPSDGSWKGAAFGALSGGRRVTHKDSTLANAGNGDTGPFGAPNYNRPCGQRMQSVREEFTPRASGNPRADQFAKMANAATKMQVNRRLK